MVADRHDAEMVMYWHGRTDRANVAPLLAAPTYVALIQGAGVIAIDGKKGDVPRILMRYQNEQESAWEQKPTTKFVKEFAKAYKEANQK